MGPIPNARTPATGLAGIPAGTPAVAGTIDALAEAYSVGYRSTGDTMVMYGSTMFMIQVTDSVIGSSHLWAMEGRIPGAYTLAAGMSTGGLVTTWLKETLGQDYSELAAAAARVAPGSEGLLLLPYFAGERTPIFDPLARGACIGLNLRHGPAQLYRSALEGIALGVRHNLDSMTATGAAAARLIAVGGGTAQRIWPQIVSDVTGLAQDLPSLTMGAAYGDARLAADAVGLDTAGWNPIAERLDPNPASAESYSHLYKLYVSAYPLLAEPCTPWRTSDVSPPISACQADRIVGFIDTGPTSLGSATGYCIGFSALFRSWPATRDCGFKGVSGPTR